MHVVIGLTIVAFQNISFLIRSLLILRLIHLKILISMVLILCRSVMPNTCYHTIGLMAVLCNLLFGPTLFSHILHEFHADIIMLSTSTSHHPVAYVVNTKYLNFKSFPPLYLSSCCSGPHLQCEQLSSILDNIVVIR